MGSLARFSNEALLWRPAGRWVYCIGSMALVKAQVEFSILGHY